MIAGLPRAALTLVGWMVIAAIPPALAQDTTSQTAPAEMAPTEQAFKISAERNVVVVRVVVRDSKGQTVSGLHKGDFRLFDNGKPQAISDFSAESSALKANPAPAESAAQPPSGAASGEGRLPTMPDRFVALYFDDVHLPFEDVARTREAARKYLAGSLQPGDRAAIYTASGRLSQDFTADRDKLMQALDKLQPHPVVGGLGRQCPDISPYQAQRIMDNQDPDALTLGVLDMIACQCSGDIQLCCNGSSSIQNCPTATAVVQGQAMQIMESDDVQSRYTLRELETIVRHLAAMPGQRSVVLISPGFLSDKLKFELIQIADRALRLRVVISALDSRGLYTYIPGGDAARESEPSASPQYMILKESFDRASMQVSDDALAELADATGGVFFHNSNDYVDGLRQTAGLPETSYVLTFTPQNLKFDGSYHKLKVTMANASHVTLQARRGYFAPKKSEDLAARAQDEIEEAVFSRDETRELPVDLNTRFFKTDSVNAKLSVVAHVDVSGVRFAKQADRNLDNLILAATLFDTDGNYVTGTKTTLDMHLRDNTLDKIQKNGVFLKAVLDAKVGTYFLRVVVRDSDSTRISAMNRTVDIPY